MRDQRRRDESEEVGEVYPTGTKPGAATLTQRFPVQRKAKVDTRSAEESPPLERYGFVQAYGGEIQMKNDAAFPDERPTPWMAAETGTSGTAGALPHLSTIQPLFGKHDVSSVRAYTDENAAAGAGAMGAEAFAVGDRVAFGSSPSLHTAAHEAAHVVQQRAGVSLKGGVGEAGDPYERHADAVADKIVRGESAESLLDEMAPSGGATRAVQRRPGVMRPDAARPERTALQITGRYEAVDPSGGNRITFELNQAGTHFEGWWQQRQMRSSGAYMLHRRIAGDITADAPDRQTWSYVRSRDGGAEGANGTMTATRTGDSVVLHLREGSGDISVGRDGSMSVDQWDHDFRRTSDAPRLSDEGIASLPAEARPAARAAEDAPLDSDEEARLRRNVDGIKERIRDFLDAPRGVARDAHAGGIDHHVETCFTNSAAEQALLVRQRMHEMLVSASFTSGAINRPYWDWIAVIVATSPSYTTHIQSRLGIPASGIAADPSAPQNLYSWNFRVVGLAGDVGVGLGGFLGQFTIEQTAGGSTWRADYFTVLGQVSGGLSAGVTVGMATSNTMQSPFPWRSGNFRGAYTITGAAAGGALADTGLAYGAGFINFFGDGSFPVVSGDAGGFTELAGLYIGGEFSQSGGYLFGGRDEAIAHARASAPRTATGTYGAGTAAHFAVDDPSLTSAGREELRRVCALHRAMLTNPSGSIAVTGYASPSGDDGHNMTLSTLRAQNTLQAIRDIMGTDLSIPPDRQTSQGLGEAPARAAGVPNGTESTVWRKVDVSVNGTVVVTLHY